MIREKERPKENRLNSVLVRRTGENALPALAAAAERPPVRYAAAFAGALLLAGARLGGTHSPLCIPFAAALTAGSNAAVLAGTIVSGIITGNIGEELVEISAVTLLLIIKLVKGSGSSVKGCTAASALSCLLCGSAVTLMGKFTAVAAAAVIFRTAVCAAAGYIFARAHSMPVGGKYMNDPVPVVICWIIAVSALCSLQIGYVNIGRAAACTVTAVYAKKHGCMGGASAGTAAACGMIMADGSFGRAAALAACAGFASGLASCRGKPAVSLTYIFSSLALAVTVGLPSGIPAFMADSVLAGVIFFALPEKIYMDMMDRLDRRERSDARHSAARFGFAAGTVDAIRNDIGNARQILLRKENGYDAASFVYGEICAKCTRAESCRLAESGTAGACFAHTARVIGAQAPGYERRLPKELSYCRRRSEIIRRFEAERSADGRRRNSVRTADVLSAASLEQLSAQSMMMRSVCGRSDLRADGRVSVMAEDALRTLGMNVRSAAVSYSREGRVFCEVFSAGGCEDGYSAATERLGDITGRMLDVPDIFEGGGTVRLRWCELPEYIVDRSLKSVPASDEPSGDSSGYFTDGFGLLYFIIADGMGSGTRAAGESCMALSLVSRLIRSGSGVASAVKYANTLLAGISADEMFTTLDIAELDIFTGKCRFYKLGAADSYIRTGGEVVKKQSGSLPVGMISGINVTCETMRLTAGDCAVMVSDGIGSDQEEYISGLMMNDMITAEICAEKIIAHSESVSGQRPDDRTAVVFKLYDY